MTLTLREDWKAILQKAWSVKFNIAAAIFGALELTIQLVQPDDVPKGAFAMFAMFASIGATGARVLAQKELTSETPTAKK